MLTAAAAVVSRPSAAAPVTTIDIVAGCCVVQVLLDGRPARMLLDTGAETSVLNRAAMVRLGLPPDRWVASTLRGAGGRLERFANADVRRAEACGVPLTQHLQGAGLSLPVTSVELPGADGLLGGDILRHYTVDLNIPGARLALRPALSTAPAGAVPLQPLRRNLLLAPAVLDGHRLVALIDTGASVSLINARGAYRLGLAHPPATPAVAIRGIGGVTDAHPHRFAALRVGALEIRDPTILMQDVPEPAYDLVLGMDILGRQRLLISYTAPALSFG